MSLRIRPVFAVLRRASARRYCVPKMLSNTRNIHSDSSSLYVHWPYCEKRCTYCNFNKYISRNVDHGAMTECLIRELATVIRSSHISAITTVFFGGGTPSLMRPQDMECILQAVAALTTAPVVEVTVECNPTAATKDQLSAFKEAGVTRVSIGMQSDKSAVIAWWHWCSAAESMAVGTDPTYGGHISMESLVSDAELVSLGRTHSVQDGLRCVELATRLFPGRVSVDVLYGRPGQTLDGWMEELRQVVQLGTAHVSLYELTVERGTQLFKDVQAGSQVLPDSETCSQMYLAAVQELEQEGLLRYEVSNFARKGHECQHNQACWKGSQYLGIGPGAHSRLLMGEGRWEARVQTLEPDPWMREVTHRGHGTRLTRLLTRQERLEELLLTGLRTARGICDQEWRAVSGGVCLFDTFTSCAEAAQLIDAGLLHLGNGCLRATKAGMNVADSLVSALLPQLKERTWA